MGSNESAVGLDSGHSRLLCFFCVPALDVLVQEAIDQRMEDVKNELLHKQKERLDVMGERLLLLSHDPVDVGAFHQTLTSLLSEKIGVLEMLKLRLQPT